MLFNFSDDELNEDFLNILLADRTTGKNIIWATNNLDEGCAATDEITPDRATLIQPRFSKSAQNKKFRVRDKAEVFTPAWICNEQNNSIDENFFARKNVFNIVDEQNHTWQATSEKIFFGEKTWQDYVKATRLEITCGEAPYLVSRYDATTGEEIPLEKRIGLLDRKFRAIHENVTDIDEWTTWATLAVQSIYGYEFQGDNLFLARKNIFFSCIEYFKQDFYSEPPIEFLKGIAEIISWNLWQMDGLTNAIPYYKPLEKNSAQVNLFEAKNVYCKIKDWQTNEVVDFRKIRGSR